MQRQSNKEKPKQTPWGPAQSTTKIAPGIASYTTASHGGLHLDKSRNAKVPACLKQSTFAGLGLKGWYEEDADWAIVVYTFPEHFASERYIEALKSLQDHHKSAWNELKNLDQSPL